MFKQMMYEDSGYLAYVIGAIAEDDAEIVKNFVLVLKDELNRRGL